MASKDEREFDSGLTGGTDVPASEEDFSLEEILAEYGAGREQRLLADVEQEVRREAEPAASVPEPAPQEPSPKAETRQKPAAPRAKRKEVPPPQKPPAGPAPILPYTRSAAAPEAGRSPAAHSSFFHFLFHVLWKTVYPAARSGFWRNRSESRT